MENEVIRMKIIETCDLDGRNRLKMLEICEFSKLPSIQASSSFSNHFHSTGEDVVDRFFVGKDDLRNGLLVEFRCQLSESIA